MWINEPVGFGEVSTPERKPIGLLFKPDLDFFTNAPLPASGLEK
jgi:hypothetical protein